MPDAIVIENLVHSYRGGEPVLRGLDLRIAEGEFVGLIGLSGAGKSTLLRCINGLVTPTSGRCVVLGESVESMPESERRLLRRRIGMIFQEFNLVDRLTVLKNVLIGRLGYLPTLSSCLHRFPASDVALARECLAQVGLESLERRRVRDLSGGQKQRVAVARTIAQGARIILADEATANLDVLTKDEIMDLLQELVNKTGATILCSMHDIALARRYCTRIIGLKNGAITFDAAPDQLSDAAVAEVLARPVHEAAR
ncbi:phosphonates import ATP-binding protein PhnC [Capsulimonas corticalis]|uniref:Phosphonates import ATP-binding protein PhnC n=1 Tax=Capsulimonas corticalis TaxID=2219043 RepID=A0A402CQ84_9BACT|nr:phosphonate ABC transporter ATP-binding protein [Capsulimonas corticalis]BDI32788.1 phosphonates import ATP-binding protein PhnC [Capsulimonas corticalis]